MSRETSRAGSGMDDPRSCHPDLRGTIDLAPLHDSAGERVSRGNVALTIRAALEMDETIGRTFEYVGGTTGIREAFRSRG